MFVVSSFPSPYPVENASYRLGPRVVQETGAIIDHEDVLSDVVTDPKNEKIFAVFAVKQTEAVISTSAAEQVCIAPRYALIPGAAD